MQHRRIISSLVLAGALASQPACLFHFKHHERTEQEREDEQKREDERLELAAIANAEIVANPVVAGALDDVKAARAQHDREPYTAWFVRYTDDTLCVRIYLQRQDYSDRPKTIDLEHFSLIAPDTIRLPRHETAISAAHAELVGFDARPVETRYKGESDGSVVRRDLFELDETYQACFEQVSRVLTASSAYAQVRFFDPQHGTFRHSWRLTR